MKLERADIPGEGVTLGALVYSPRELHSDGCVVLAHGFTASKESLDILAGYLCARGFGCVSFDFRGHKLGCSTGELRHAEEVVQDLRSAAEWAMARFESRRVILAGHSMGAHVSLVGAARWSFAAGAAAITTGPNPSSGFRQPVGIAMLRQRRDYIVGEDPMRILEQMDELAHSIHQTVPKPTLLVAARQDAIIKPERVAEMARMVGPHAQVAEIDSTHLEAPDRARVIVANWLDAHFRIPTGG